MAELLSRQECFFWPPPWLGAEAKVAAEPDGVSEQADLGAAMEIVAPNASPAALWDQVYADQLATEISAYIGKVQRKPAEAWKSVREICLNLIRESIARRNLPLLRERCAMARKIADGMPAFRS